MNPRVLGLSMVTEMRAIPHYDIGFLDDFTVDVSGEAVIRRVALLTVFVFDRMIGHYEEISRGKSVGGSVLGAPCSENKGCWDPSTWESILLFPPERSPST